MLWAEIYRPGAEYMMYRNDKQKDILDATIQAGKELVETRRVSLETLARIEQPLTNNVSDFAKIANCWWKTCISMPRQSRIDAPGALHHVIVRGIERRNIFRDDQDRYNFLERIGALVEGTATVCYAWALIPNHFHLLLQTGAAPIATFMRRLLTGHAVSFNPAFSWTTAAMGTCSRTGTNRSCARKIPICSNWCATFI